MDTVLLVIDAIAREAMLFAAIGFLIGGIDDLAVDLAYLWCRICNWFRPEPPRALDKPAGRIAIFIAAWDESAVIGQMLRATLARYDYPDYRLYVGVYPNDTATIAIVEAVAAIDARVRPVIGLNPGPTTKADCLNSLWRTLLDDESREGEAHAVVLHDAEDLVHPDELRVFAAYLTDHAAVQVPVLPLPDPRSPLISGHYLDEFATAHTVHLAVRETLRAGIPFAGVGCAIDRKMLARIADARGGDPFDDTSLTEDYELGLTVAALGGRTKLARVRDGDGELVAVRAYFPAALSAAVRQKARWMTGIALAGWDRVGWGRAGAIGDHWMRMRDRRATLAIPVLAIAYLALVAWGLSLAGHGVTATAMPLPEGAMRWLLGINAVLLGWRVLCRALCTGRAHGWRQAALSVPRIFVANLVALLAARRALKIYWPTLDGKRPHWEKTAHHFPDQNEGTAG
ncbi:glycosyl transferase family protein [Sphingomonas sp. LT1P40]